MSKIYTVTINGKEQTICGSIVAVSLRSHKMDIDFYSEINAEVIANAQPNLFKPSAKYSELFGESALTFDLSEFAKLFGIKGRLANKSGYGHTMASHKATWTQITIIDDRASD